MDLIPEFHFGTLDPVDWHAEAPEPDDDEFRGTPADVVALLGFDPAGARPMTHLLKAHVKTHPMRTKGGGVTIRREHEDKRTRREGKIETVGVGITPPDKTDGGVVEALGKKLRSVRDVARLAQMFRSPQYETLRYIYVRGSVVVGYEDISCRAPAYTAAFVGDPEASIKAIGARMRNMQADGLWMIHNHPTGNPTPSKEDIALTKRLAVAVNLKGHVVVNSNRYAAITVEAVGYEAVADVAYHDIATDDESLKPQLPHEVLGELLLRSDDVMRVARTVTHAPGYATLLYRNAEGKVAAVQCVPAARLASTDKRGLRRFFRMSARHFGAVSVIVAVDAGDGTITSHQRGTIIGLVNDGMVLDVISYDRDGSEARSARDSGIPQGPDLWRSPKIRPITHFLRKSRVKAHERHTQDGQVVQVREHEDRRTKKLAESPKGKANGYMGSLLRKLARPGAQKAVQGAQKDAAKARSKKKAASTGSGLSAAIHGSLDAEQRTGELLADLPEPLRLKCRREAKGAGHEIQLTIKETKVLLKKGTVGFISAGRNPNDPEDAALPDALVNQRTEKLRADLVERGFKFTRAKGKYGEEEETFLVMVPAMARTELVELGSQYKQDSVIFSDHDKNELIFTTGEHKGQRNEGNGFQVLDQEAADFYTEIKTPKGKLNFTLNFDFSRLVKALNWLLRKGQASVKAHTRRTKAGGMALVHEHQRRTQDARAADRLVTPKEAAQLHAAGVAALGPLVNELPQEAFEYPERLAYDDWLTGEYRHVMAALVKLHKQDPEAFYGAILALGAGNMALRRAVRGLCEDFKPTHDKEEPFWELTLAQQEMLASLTFARGDPLANTWDTWTDLTAPRKCFQGLVFGWTDLGSSSYAGLLLTDLARQVVPGAAKDTREGIPGAKGALAKLSKTRYGEHLRATVTAGYRATQTSLALRKEVPKLYRGVRRKHTRAPTLASWTERQAVAESFDGGGTLVETVPAEKVLAKHGSSWWSSPFSEKEWIVLA